MSDNVEHQNRLFVTDKTDGARFLVDTGADVSVFPRARCKGNVRPTRFVLYAANKTAIPTFGTVTRTIDLDLHRKFE